MYPESEEDLVEICETKALANKARKPDPFDETYKPDPLDHTEMPYFRAMREATLLTRERELEISRIKNDPSTPKDEVLAVTNELITHNLRFVPYLAKRLRIENDMEEMIADGIAGLVKAAHRFDATKGHSAKGRFTSYAMWYIKQHIYEGIRRRKHSVNVTRGVWDFATSVARGCQPHGGLVRFKRAKEVMKIVEIPLFTGENEDWFEIPDPNSHVPMEEMEVRDLVAQVMLVIKSMGLNQEDLDLILKIGENGVEYIQRLATKRGVTKSNIRMLKMHLYQRIRKRLLARFGRAEFDRIAAMMRSPRPQEKEKPQKPSVEKNCSTCWHASKPIFKGGQRGWHCQHPAPRLLVAPRRVVWECHIRGCSCHGYEPPLHRKAEEQKNMPGWLKTFEKGS